MLVAVYGANGRMGRELLAAAEAAGHSTLAITRAMPQTDSMLQADAVIDFSTPQASSELVNLLQERENSCKKLPALLVGTTGLVDDYFKAHRALKTQTFWASNTSVGIAVLTELAKRAAKALEGYDIEICEAHHKHKKDAPSGTALSIAKELAAVRNAQINTARNGERAEGEIGVCATRGGDIAGRHVVGFYGDGQWLEFTHFASNRSIFASGAIQIAQWLINQPVRHYGMSDFVDAKI